MTYARRAPGVLAVAVTLGLLGDQLIRAPVWGINVTLGLLAVAGTAAALSRGRRPDLAANPALWPWLAAGFFALMWTVRDAPMLLAADLLVVLALSSLPLIPNATLAAAGAVETVMAPARAAWHSALGAFRLAPEMRPFVPQTLGGTRATSVGIGLLIALPAVLVFGSLFASADPLFGAAVSSLISVDLGPLVSHVFVAAALAWVIAGYLWAVARPPRAYLFPRLRPELGALTVSTTLGAVALVFTAFLATQAGSLFGGEGFISEHTGLTYAEYARRGFFQMIAASALSLPLVYVAPFSVGEPANGSGSVSLRSLMGLQLALTGLVLMSALWRMGLYVRAYGLTEDRLYGTVVMLWIGVTLATFARTVLRARPAGAAFGSVVAAAVLLAALNLANPRALIARYNLDHPGRRGADVGHLAQLGDDALPVVVSRLDEVAAERRCQLARALVTRHTKLESRGDWRGWSLARARARRAVRQIAPLVGSCPPVHDN